MNIETAKVVRVITYYLPQFHPIPENDKWWGKGFTEWTNVAQAKPLFRGHYQPHIPADLGFYDLRLPETRVAQADMARYYGVEGFCYYHYWFAGKTILDRPFNEVLNSKVPNFPFCLCWANHSWKGIWGGCPGRTLIEQSYPGPEDHAKHFELLLRAFTDERYITVDGKPLFVIYDPSGIPDVNRMTDTWREMAIRSGLNGLHLVGMEWETGWNPEESGFDASTPHRLPKLRQLQSPSHRINIFIQKILSMRHKPTVYLYEKILPMWKCSGNHSFDYYPCLVPCWDNTPRCGYHSLILHGSTPELFQTSLQHALDYVSINAPARRIIFIKSWNEWAEGNHLEPDLRFGKGYLEAISETVRELDGDIRKAIPDKG